MTVESTTSKTFAPVLPKQQMGQENGQMATFIGYEEEKPAAVKGMIDHILEAASLGPAHSLS